MNKNRWQEISRLYYAALDQPETERKAFLNGCRDEDLRQEVLSLLADESLAESFLEEPALGVARKLKMKEPQSLTGSQLGPYQVISELGSGGMGRVYEAKDTKLGRNVAIKVLLEDFATDDMRIARFQREARLLASLNHPNIAIIHGLEESDDTHILVLELVEGDTLSDRLKRGAIPVEESLKLALQIADALEAAHEKGVIHRDLKPANIKITPDGKVKVLDFGLAKAFAGEQAEVNLSNSPTLSITATEKGVILGTAAYMSPEQARGETVDKKTDVWAFGVVLFEMLTGRGMFEERSVSDTLAAVLRKEPEWDSLPSSLHPRIRLLLERCLEKESKNRYHDIADARVDLQKVLEDPSGVLGESFPATDPRSRLKTILPWVAAAITLTAIIASVFVWNLRTPEPRRAIYFTDELPDGRQFSDLNEDPIFTVSPDGTQFVYSTTEGLYLRSVDERNARLIPGTEERTASPLFSHDGQSIAYWSTKDNKLKKVAVNGGIPVPLTSDRPLSSMSWSADDTILYAGIKGIMRISSKGGTPETLIETEDDPLFNPRLLPDGKSVIFTISKKEGYQVAVQSLESGKREILIAGSTPNYFPTGHLVYNVGYDLYAVPFDIKTLEITGEEIQMIEGIYVTGPPQYAISASGTLVYLSKKTIGSFGHLVWVDHDGKEKSINAPPRSYDSPRISPDGTQVALGTWDTGNGDIGIWDLNRENFSRLTSDDALEGYPLWTPDNQWIVFSRSSGASWGIYRIASNGTGDIERLYSQPGQLIRPESWSSDGKNLLCQTNWVGLVYDIGMLSMEGDPVWRLLLQEDHSESQPQISPDGKWMAYTSNESGRPQIYVRSFPDVDDKKLMISTDGGNSPLWSSDGRELFYRDGDAVISVMVETEPELKAERPEILFNNPNLLAQWDLHPDGKRFLMIKRAETTDGETTDVIPRKINVVLNWFEELKERIPTD